MATINKLPEGSTWDKFIVDNVTSDVEVQVTFAPDTNDNDIPDKYENFKVSVETSEGGSADPESQVVAFGQSATINITPETGYVVDTITVGDITYVNNPNYGTVFANDIEAITNAVTDPEIDTVSISAPMESNVNTQFDKPMTIDGNNEVITQTTTGKTFTMTKDSTVNDVVIASTADNTAWHSSYGIQFYTGNHTLNNAKLSGGNAGIIVNGATLTLSGTIDVSNNTFGGIEVSKGSAEGLTAGVLNINGATLVNTTEEYGKPTIWIDGNTDADGIVNGAETLTMVEVPHGDTTQKQYYLNAVNTKPILVGNNSYDTLAEAVTSSDGTEISVKSDVAENITVPAGSNVVIDGEGHTMYGMFNLQSGTTGQKGSIKVSNMVFDGKGTTIWALQSQNQTETAGQSSFDVEFTNCEFKNLTKKALYMTEITKLTLTGCTFTNCATDEMNEPNTYGDYVIDCNLVGVKDVEVSISDCTFSGNKAQKADIKVTQRGGESDEGASDMPQGITATVTSFNVKGCTFNDTEVGAVDIQIGSDNKSAETNPDAENTTGAFGSVNISGNTTETTISTPYDGETYNLSVGQTFYKTGSDEPVIF